MQFARADVTRSALRLLYDGAVWIPGELDIADVPMCQLNELGQIGPDRRDIMDGFEQTDSVTAYPMVHGHNTNARNRLIVEPDKYLSPLAVARSGRSLKPLEQLWSKSARLLIAERIWLETVRVVTMRSAVRVLSNTWWEVGVENDAWEKPFAVWLNSSLGLLTIMAERTSTRGGWVAMKKGDLRRLPVLDTRALAPAQLRAMAQLFDDLADAEFERLPAMADCPARQRLDQGLADILSLPDLSALRRLLATEPVVSNQRL